MFAKLLALGTLRFIGLSNPSTITLSETHPDLQATWEIIDPLQIGLGHLISGMVVTIKNTASSPPTLLEWFTSGGGGVRTTASVIPTGATKFLIRVPGSRDGTPIPHGGNITISAKPAVTGWRAFFSGLMSIFTGSAPAWYVSATGTSLALRRLSTPGPAETFTIFEAPTISNFTVAPVRIPFPGTAPPATGAVTVSFLSSTPPGGATVDFTVHTGIRFVGGFPGRITVPADQRFHTEPLPLKWDFRSCEKLSIEASTVVTHTRQEVAIADFLAPCPFFTMALSRQVIDVSNPPQQEMVSVDFTYDPSAWPTTPTKPEALEITLSSSHPGISFSQQSWEVLGADAGQAMNKIDFTFTPVPKQDCLSIIVTFNFYALNPRRPLEFKPNREGIVVLMRPA